MAKPPYAVRIVRAGPSVGVVAPSTTSSGTSVPSDEWYEVRSTDTATSGVPGSGAYGSKPDAGVHLHRPTGCVNDVKATTASSVSSSTSAPARSPTPGRSMGTSSSHSSATPQTV